MSKEDNRDTGNDPMAEPTEPSAKAKANESELQSCIDRLQRLQAEFENYKKRVAKDIATLEERITDQVVLDFLTPYENLERAFHSHEAQQDVELFVAGVEKIYAQFAQILEQRGIEEIPSEGKLFDPALHEAVLTAPSEEEKNTIIEVFSPGFLRNGRVLRVSKVSVSQGPAIQEE